MDSKWFIVKLISVLFEHQKTTEVSLFHNMLYKFLLLTSKKIWYLLIHVTYLKSVFDYVNKLLDNVYLITNINRWWLEAAVLYVPKWTNIGPEINDHWLRLSVTVSRPTCDKHYCVGNCL